MGAKTLMEEIYEDMRGLPNHYPEDLDTRGSNAESNNKGSFFYNLITTIKNCYRGISGRKKIWKEKILPYFFDLPAVKLAKAENLEMKVSNNFFRSRIILKDIKTNSSLKIKAPWFSSLFSYFLGNYTKSKLYLPNVEEIDYQQEQSQAT